MLLRRAGDGWNLGDIARVHVPRLLRQVILDRLSRLGQQACDLLSIAAVIGEEIPLALWGRVSDADEATLFATAERAVDARVLRDLPDGDRLAFGHALLREALYESMLAARRRAWHRRIAEALAEDSSATPATVADHFRRAGDPREAEWLVRAGERARALHAPRAAIASFTRALELARRCAGVSVQAIHRGRGLAYETLGEFEWARANLETVHTLGRTSGDRTGTHRNSWNGIPPAGGRIELPVCAIFPFDADEKLAGERVYFDMALMLRQLGALPESSG